MKQQFSVNPISNVFRGTALLCLLFLSSSFFTLNAEPFRGVFISEGYDTDLKKTYTKPLRNLKVTAKCYDSQGNNPNNFLTTTNDSGLFIIENIIAYVQTNAITKINLVLHLETTFAKIVDSVNTIVVHTFENVEINDDLKSFVLKDNYSRHAANTGELWAFIKQNGAMNPLNHPYHSITIKVHQGAWASGPNIFVAPTHPIGTLAHEFGHVILSSHGIAGTSPIAAHLPDGTTIPTKSMAHADDLHEGFAGFLSAAFQYSHHRDDFLLSEGCSYQGSL